MHPGVGIPDLGDAHAIVCIADAVLAGAGGWQLLPNLHDVAVEVGGFDTERYMIYRAMGQAGGAARDRGNSR